MIRQFELVERVKKYDPGVDEDALNRAYVFSMKAHGSQTRASGDAYFSHPLEVAGILTRYRLDGASIVTALLHDTLEDTNVTFDELIHSFGEEVAQLVDGVTKLSQLELQSDKAKQAENFRKLVLAMSRDIRVLLVKLADRLHNMRTLWHIRSADKRRRIARETMDIYAPLAERIGMNDIKDELQDLSFQELNLEARDSVLKRLGFLREKGGESLIGRILEELERTLAEGGVKAALSGREKTPYSIWHKMQYQQVGFEALSDIMAFRAVVDTVADSYQALGVIHSRYPLIPGRFKDYISTPKPNGYRSLHTGVVGPEGQRIELQIRTREMHDVAERGVAAHWQYKEGFQHPTDGRQYRWLQELLDILESAAGPVEFLEHTKLEMFHDQVFCFSPKGDVYALPQGATPIDFAYAVHSEVGDHCVGAKVNGRMVPLRVALQNGDQVEVLTSSKQTPSPEWEQVVVTGKARSRIRRFIQREQQEQYISLGRNIVHKAAQKEKRELTEAVLREALEALGCERIEELYARVGEGLITAREVIERVYPETKRLLPSLKLPRRPRPKGKAGEHAVPIRGLIPGMALHLAKCCYPLPGDRIVGIVTTGKGVTIHTIDCDTLANFSDSPERWLDVAWDVDEGQHDKLVSRLLAVLINEPGSLRDLAAVIAKHEGNISNLKFTNRTMDFFDMMVDVEVRDARHLATIVAALRAAPAVVSVSRARQ